MAAERPNSGHQPDEGMEWESATEDKIMTVRMNRKEAEVLLKLGLQKEFHREFSLDLNIHADNLGLQIHIADKTYNALKDDLLQLINKFLKNIQASCKKLPFYFELPEVLNLTAVTTRLTDAVADLGAYLDIDTQNGVFMIYAVSEDVHQKCTDMIQGTLVEGRIDISDIKNELYQDAGWCNFQSSVIKQNNNDDFVVAVNENAILITGIYESVEKVYTYLKKITDNLRCVPTAKSQVAVTSNQVSVENSLAEESAEVEVDFPIDSHNVYVYRYLKAFQKKLDYVKMKQYEEIDRQGFVLKGPGKCVEDAEKQLNNIMKQIRNKKVIFEDNGYFLKPEGQKFLKEKIQQGCGVVCEMCREGQDSSNRQRSISPSWHERDGHGSLHWTVEQRCHIVLAKSKADEMSADIVINMKEVKSPNERLQIQQKQMLMEVPKYTPALALDMFNDRLEQMYQKVTRNGYTAITISLDDTGTWPLGAIVPRIIRSFSSYIQKNETKLSLLLCTTVPDTLDKAKGIIQGLMKEIYQVESGRKVPEQPLKTQIVKGELHKIQADILVNTTGPDLDLSNGAVSQSLLSEAGYEMQKELYDKHKKDRKLQPGEIIVTKGHKLKCKHVIHGVLEDFETKQANDVYQESIKTFMLACLEKAESLQCRTIAFPAVGTGRLEYPVEIVAEEMFWIVYEFGKEHPNTKLSDVMFVIYPDDQQAFQVFEDKKKETAQQQSACGSSLVTFHFIGPEENIEKAKQHVEDRLTLLQSKSGLQEGVEEIHGVTFINYQLLRYFHKDFLHNRNERGIVFEWKDGILKVIGHKKNIGVVTAEIRSLLTEQVATLAKVEVCVEDIDSDIIQNRESPEICILYQPEKKKKTVVICGKDRNSVDREKKHLDELRLCSVGNTQQHHARDTKIESVKTVSVIDVPKDIYLVMCKKYNDLEDLVVTYNPNKQRALVNNKGTKQFEKRLFEAKSLQKECVEIPDDKQHIFFNKDDTVYKEGNVICVHQPELSIITVFGPDQKSVSDEIHKIKLKLGLIETTNRTERELTGSYQSSESSKLDDSWEVISSDEPMFIDQGPSNSATYGARPKAYHNKTHLTKADASPETFKTKEGIPVLVYKQDILRAKVDCIVNAANDTLKHGGGIAKVISKAAGDSLDKECDDQIKRCGKLSPGQVFTSKAGKLSFKRVIHAVGPCWSDYKPHSQDQVKKCKEDLKNAILNSLKEAEKRGLETIAIPAISSAIFAVPEDICTSMYAEGVIEYSNTATSPTRLKEIHFVDSNSHIVGKIQQRFRKMLNETGQQSQGSYGKPRQNPTDHSVGIQRQSEHVQAPRATTYPFYKEEAYDYGFKHQLICHFSPTFHLIVEQGSVFDKSKKVDGIVCSDNKDGKGKGFVAKTLLEKGGQKYKSAVEKAFRSVHFGDVVTVNGTGTGFGKVFLAIMSQKEPSDTENQRKYKFRSMFKAVFRKVDAENCKTIMMPLMFTGEGKVKPAFCTERFLESCLEFSKETRKKLTVYLINNEEWKADTIVQMTKDFVALQKTLAASVQEQQRSQRSATTSPSRKPAKGRGGPMNRSQKSSQIYTGNQSDQNKPRANSGSDKGAISDSLVSRDSLRSSESRARYSSDENEDSRMSQPPSTNTNESCVICQDSITDPKSLPCAHVFCRGCIDHYLKNYKQACPTCGKICGIITGDQPKGTMDDKTVSYEHCAGYEKCGRIEITYTFPSGRQAPEHPNPGRYYQGITRKAYLPDNKEGRVILELLKIAFKRRLVFTIGSSRTTGKEDVITWNDIHHKTNPYPNTQFGYPDPDYLSRVKDELAAKGVTVQDIPQLSASRHAGGYGSYV